jgi:SET domain-containing protein
MKYVGYYNEEDEEAGHINNLYCFDICRGYALDSEKEGNPTRYINHSSTKPNLKQLFVGVNGEKKIGFYAMTEIPAETELFFDYGKAYWDELKAMQQMKQV